MFYLFLTPTFRLSCLSCGLLPLFFTLANDIVYFGYYQLLLLLLLQLLLLSTFLSLQQFSWFSQQHGCH